MSVPRVSTFVLLSVLLAAGCSYSDLSVHGKQCSPEHDCPDGWSCVYTPLSSSERVGTCYEQGQEPACPADRFCGTEGNWVEQCDDGYSSSILEECTGEEICHPDLAACVSSCSQESDCGPENTCDLALGLCRPFPACDPPDCPDGKTCVDSSVCVAVPSADASTGSGVMDLDCFRDAVVAPPSTPENCDISGRVYLFPSSSSEQTVGLNVVLRPAGDPGTEVATVAVEEDPNHTCPSGSDTPCGLYQFSSVPTNEVYDIEVQAGTSSLGKTVVTTIRAGVALRADRCNGGQFALALAVMSQENFDTYTGVVFSPFDTDRALVMGLAADCGNAQGQDRQALGNVIVDLAIGPVSPGRIYYFADDTIVRPDLAAVSSTHKGTYAAVGVPACRNRVGFAAYLGGLRVLGSLPFTAQPGSVVFADLPLPVESLP